MNIPANLKTIQFQNMVWSGKYLLDLVDYNVHDTTNSRTGRIVEIEEDSDGNPIAKYQFYVKGKPGVTSGKVFETSNLHHLRLLRKPRDKGGPVHKEGAWVWNKTSRDLRKNRQDPKNK